MQTTYELTLNGNLGPNAYVHEKKAFPMDKVHFYVQLEDGATWKIQVPYNLRAQVLVNELAKTIQQSDPHAQWLLFREYSNFPLDPKLSLRENDVWQKERLSLVFAFEGEW